MGQARIKKTATQKLIEVYPKCCFCAGERPSTEREHMPPKSLFDHSHRPDQFIMPSCKECNGGTSTADLIVAIVSRWGEAPSTHIDHAKLVHRARKQAPNIVNEWTEHLDRIQIRGRRHLRHQGVPVPFGAKIVAVGENTIRQLNIFSHKATLALYFEQFKKPLSANGAFCAYWQTKEDYLANGLPQALLELLPNYGTLIQGHWNESKTFEYRYDLNPDEGLFGFFARLRHGLFIAGFAVDDRCLVEANGPDWINPRDFLNASNSPRFQKRI
ncbi:MAG TPA: hypothetical protein VH858_10830 [Hyphomicrobiales bacterium]|jgi:hypothetical protein